MGSLTWLYVLRDVYFLTLRIVRTALTLFVLASIAWFGLSHWAAGDLTMNSSCGALLHTFPLPLVTTPCIPGDPTGTWQQHAALFDALLWLGVSLILHTLVVLVSQVVSRLTSSALQPEDG